MSEHQRQVLATLERLRARGLSAEQIDGFVSWMESRAKQLVDEAERERRQFAAEVSK